MKIKTVLTIAGSDSSGGAGIQADIKTVTAFGLYASSAVTAVTAQNTLGVQRVFPLSADAVEEQIKSVCTDIFPDAVKTGMLCTAENVHAVSEQLKKFNIHHIVVDPVAVSTSGHMLLDKGGIQCMINELFPIAEIITPNIPELDILYESLCSLDCAVLIKGGHKKGNAEDLLYRSGKLLKIFSPESVYNTENQIEGIIRFSAQRIKNKNTHGTGCTFSSAAACGLAEGKNIEESVRNAKIYITGAIKSMLCLGSGRGPLNHMWNMHESDYAY